MVIGAYTGKWARRCLVFVADVQLNLVDLREQFGLVRANLQEYGERVRYHEVDMLDVAKAFPTRPACHSVPGFMRWMLPNR